MIPSKDKMVVCFLLNYKRGLKHIVGNFIKKLIGTKYAHVEIWLPSIKKSFSASGWEDKVRFTDKINFNHEQWDFYEVPSDKYDESEVIKKCKIIEGYKYDNRGVRNYYFFDLKSQRFQNNDEFWCSEAVAWVLGWFYFRISQKTLHKIIVKQKWKKL